MNSKAENLSREFKERLERLEGAVETPVVPGEAHKWLQSASLALEDTQSAYQTQLVDAHSKCFEEISSEDSDLWTHVQQMQQEDETIRSEFKRLARIAAEILPSLQGQQPGVQEQQAEAATAETLEEFGEDALQLIIRIRKQEAALETWLNEALLRDRGTGD